MTLQSWEQFRPSKGLWLGSCVACAVATMIVGFTWGGWVTGGTATEMAADARENARAELVANLCVDNFLSGPDAAQKLADLKAAKSWERDDFIEQGGWIAISGLKEQVTSASDLCAEQLAAMDAIPDSAAEEPDTVSAQPASTEG